MPQENHLRQAGLAALLFAMLVAGCLAFYTRHNTFPCTYHVDEQRKVVQIRQGYRNFWHPLLLLTATDASTRARFPGEQKLTSQQVVETGRWCSATFAALAVAVFAALAWLTAGRLAAVFTAILVGTHPQLYEAAHYMKEDTGLILGIALSLLALEFFRRSPGWAEAAFLGFANAIAISGKYVGAVMVLPTLWVLITAGRGRWPLRFAAYFGGLVLTVACINFPALADPGLIGRGVAREWDLMVQGHDGAGHSVPHLLYVVTFLRLVSFPVILLAAVHVWKVARLRSGWLPIVFATGYVLMLSWFPKTADRYLLPVVMATCYLAALASADLAKWAAAFLHRRSKLPLRPAFGVSAAVVLVAGLFVQLPMLARYQHEFATDSRASLARWIRDSLPADTAVAWGIWVQLPAIDGRPIPHPEKPANDFCPLPNYVADHGTLDELARRGIRYVAVAHSEYYTLLAPGFSPAKQAREIFDRRRAFYLDLFKRGHVVWQSKAGFVNNLHPGIDLYELPAAPAQQVETRVSQPPTLAGAAPSP